MVLPPPFGIRGQRLWEQFSLILPAGTPIPIVPATKGTPAVGQVDLAIDPDEIESIMVIPLAPLASWADVVVAVGTDLAGDPEITLTSAGGATVNGLLWLPHTEIGPGFVDDWGTPSDPAVPPPAPNGQLLWTRRAVAIAAGRFVSIDDEPPFFLPGSTTLQTGLKQQILAGLSGPFGQMASVIPLSPMNQWFVGLRGIFHGDVADDGSVVFINTQLSPVVINVLVWEPHTVFGPGDAIPYV